MNFTGRFKVLKVVLNKDARPKITLSDDDLYKIVGEVVGTLTTTQVPCHPGDKVKVCGVTYGVRGGKIRVIIKELEVIQ